MNVPSTTPHEPARDQRPGPDTGSGVRAVRRLRYGGTEHLEVVTIERPRIGADDVLVQVHTAGIDRGVWHLMAGLPYLVRLAGYGLRRPAQPVLGLDVAGVVIDVGADVTRFRPGDRVFGIADGSFAELAAAKADRLSHLPDDVTFAAAGVSAVSGSAALQALTRIGRVESGQRVLIIGASGGVGSFAVQIARSLGAHVTGVCSTAKVDRVRALGAERVIDYTREDFVDGTRYDLILDIGGRSPLRRLRGALAPRGTLVIVGGEDGNRVTGGIGRQLRAVVMSPFVRQRLTTFVAEEHHRWTDQLAEGMADGSITPVVDAEVDLDDVAAAIDRLTDGSVSGKLAVRVAPVSS